MPRETGAQLAKFAKSRIGDALRTVVVVHETDREVIYLREDLREQYSAERYESVTESFRIDMDRVLDGSGDYPLGAKSVIIHCHETATCSSSLTMAATVSC